VEIKANKRPHSFPKVNQALLENILIDIELGSPRKHAAESHGISRRHFHYLVAQGILDLEFGKTDTMHALLVRSLRTIEKKEIQECRKNIRNSSKGHDGAQWTLEHAYWRDFGKDANAKELAEELERLREEMKGVTHGKIECSETQEDSNE
jgi:hypothetical protein